MLGDILIMKALQKCKWLYECFCKGKSSASSDFYFYYLIHHF